MVSFPGPLPPKLVCFPAGKGVCFGGKQVAKEITVPGTFPCTMSRTIGADHTLPRGKSMNDTPPEMEARYRDMLMQRSGEERLKMGCVMRETARALVEASIREQDPQATPEAVRKGLFLRFYGHEFDAESRAKILAAIEWATHSVAR